MSKLSCKQTEFEALIAEWDPCQGCPLHNNNTPTAENPNGKAHGRGNLDAPIMLVGEAPGQEESRSGNTFYPDSPAGKKLQSILKYYKLEDNVFLANPVLCRSVNKNGKNCKPKPEHYEACSPRFKALVDIIKPQIIVALGGGALQALTGYTGSVTKVMGQEFKSPYGTVLAAVHPMFYVYAGGGDESLRDKSKKLWEHISSFASL